MIKDTPADYDINTDFITLAPELKRSEATHLPVIVPLEDKITPPLEVGDETLYDLTLKNKGTPTDILYLDKAIVSGEQSAFVQEFTPSPKWTDPLDITKRRFCCGCGKNKYMRCIHVCKNMGYNDKQVKNTMGGLCEAYVLKIKECPYFNNAKPLLHCVNCTGWEFYDIKCKRWTQIVLNSVPRPEVNIPVYTPEQLNELALSLGLVDSLSWEEFLTGHFSWTEDK